MGEEKFYDLETYVFEEVGRNFRVNRLLSGFDFFCIIIWKANRAKSRVAGRLLSHGDGFSNLDLAVRELAHEISAASGNKSRMKILIEDWGFRLPIASAILTVLYPDQFTVYDYRVCEALTAHKHVQYRKNFEVLWADYLEYMRSVRESYSDGDLREKDKRLWGCSFKMQLEENLASNFRKTEAISEDEN